MPNEEGMKVLDVRLANVEEAIMKMKESQQKIGDALTELVRLASRHEEHRTHIEKRMNQLDEVDERLRKTEVELGQLSLVNKGVIAAVGTVLTAVFAFIWNAVTHQSY